VSNLKQGAPHRTGDLVVPKEGPVREWLGEGSFRVEASREPRVLFDSLPCDCKEMDATTGERIHQGTCPFMNAPIDRTSDGAVKIRVGKRILWLANRFFRRANAENEPTQE